MSNKQGQPSAGGSSKKEGQGGQGFQEKTRKQGGSDAGPKADSQKRGPQPGSQRDKKGRIGL